MMWLASDTLFGYWLLFPVFGKPLPRFTFSLSVIGLAFWAVGGFVTVGQMLRQYESCLDIGSGI
jgi:hypothetical protein